MKLSHALLAGALALSVAACQPAEPPAPPPASKADAEDCYRKQDYRCAAINYYGYLKLYPNETDTRAIYAITLTKSGQHALSIAQYEMAMNQGAGAYDLFANYAISLDAVGKLDESMKWNRKTLELIPGLVDVRGTLAQQLVRQGKHDEAIKLLQDFDAYLKKNNHPPYFTAQIMTIKDAKAKAAAKAG